ncbi:MAG: TonB-dependent receptor [Bacteroidota bacterium]|nr:TonB-dependent receptor [Bacteroidota bacterium]
MKKTRKPYILPKECKRSLLVLKLIVTLLFTGLITANASQDVSQISRISLRIQNQNLQETFKIIEKKSGYYFFYKDNDLNKQIKVNLNAKDETLGFILEKVLEKTNLDYKIVNQYIVINARANKTPNHSSEPKTTSTKKGNKVTGTITNEKGEPIIGVSILLKGTTIGTATDVDGNYSIDVPVGSKTLLFSFIGMLPQEINVDRSQTLNVVLKEDTKGLEEVMVVGYGTQKKGSVIGSVDKIETKQLRQPTRTVSTSLAGRLAGVVAVQSSGEPGYDGAQFWIRGVNTFAGNTSPLILVDGVERSIDDIDPEEIADFAILKDATATAVYGVRGANGVVLITTKKGFVGKPNINIRFENGLTKPLQLPSFVDGATYMELQNEAKINVGGKAMFSQSQIDNTRKGTDPYYYPDVNWMHALLKPLTPSQRATINVSGGSERVRYFVSGAFLNQDGMYRSFKLNSYDNNINVKRYNFRSNVDMNLTGTTLLSVQLAGILEDRDYPGASSTSIFGNMLDTPPIYYPLQYPDKTKIPGYPYSMGRNPFQLLAASGYTTEYHTNLQSNMSLNQELSFITKGLQAKVMFAFDTYTSAAVNRVITPRPYLIKPWGFDADGNPILKDSKGKYNYVDQDPANSGYHDYLERSASSPSTARSVYCESSLIYNRNFGKHEVGGLLLYNQSDDIFPSTSGIYESVPKRHQGLTGRATYAYNEKYFAEYNFGYNGSENFAKGKRYGYFPSYAIGWIPSNESFMNFLKPSVELLKFRFSYGKVGNDQIGSVAGVSRFAYLTRVEATSTSVGFGTNNGGGYGSGSGINISYYGNPDATWETAAKSNLGMELKLKNGFNIQTDVFYEKRTNIWTQLSKVFDIFGFGGAQPGANIGEMENKGIDGFIEYQKAFNKDWSINFKGTFSYAKNKVLANGAAAPKYAYQSTIGHPYGSQMGYIAEGLFIDDAEIKNSPDQSYLGTVKPGDIKYRDINKDGKIDNFDQVFIGKSYIPEITYGLGVGTVYKLIDFSCLFQGADNVTFFAKPLSFPEVNRRNVLSIVETNRWSPENQNIYASIPRLGIGTQENNYVNSTFWQRDGRYIRLKQVELGCTLPESLLKRIQIKSARIYVNGMNLLTWAPFKWWDPEAQSSNGMIYPPQKIFNMGLEIKF